LKPNNFGKILRIKNIYFLGQGEMGICFIKYFIKIFHKNCSHIFCFFSQVRLKQAGFRFILKSSKQYVDGTLNVDRTTVIISIIKKYMEMQVFSNLMPLLIISN